MMCTMMCDLKPKEFLYMITVYINAVKTALLSLLLYRCIITYAHWINNQLEVMNISLESCL